jgi:hypothetical protein
MEESAQWRQRPSLSVLRLPWIFWKLALFFMHVWLSFAHASP